MSVYIKQLETVSILNMMKSLVTALVCILILPGVFAQQQAVIKIDATKQGARISPTLHGIFFEEISHAGEGGLYAELIQNRGFEETRIPAGTKLENNFLVPFPEKPHFMIEPQKTDWKLEWPHKSAFPAWSQNSVGSSSMMVSLTQEKPLTTATPNSLSVEIENYDPAGKAELINEGFWGINAVAGESYNLSFYLRSDARYKSPVTASLQSANGTVLATHVFSTTANSGWKKYTCKLIPATADAKARFVLSFGGKGKVWVDFVSLFPVKTFKNRPNGLRKDLAEMIAGLKPSFVRWPGGCYVEGVTIESAPDWKNSIGQLEKRPGSFSPWGYWSSDGFGYHEYLQFCEDIGADALYVFNAGVSCEYRSGTYIPESELQPYIQNALDAIEYALGPVTSKYGKMRAANGHPKPFPLKYAEIGNEQHGPKYASRYNIFYKAIQEKYPRIRLMASMGIGDVNQHTLKDMKQVDIVDEHAYKDAYWSMRNPDHFDKYKRGAWDMYVGEFATNAGVGNGNMQAALSDAIYMIGMERNSDLVKWSSYAPLLVNVNDVDWPVNLINFDASKSVGRISYYAIKSFVENRADVNLSSSVTTKNAAVVTPLFAGSIGMGTWDTQTEYKDVEIIENGVSVYKSDFINRGEEWAKVRGKWNVRDSAFAQTAEGAQQFAMLKNKSFSNYTLKIKGRKLSGYNAFIIPFAVKDSNSYMRAHIGSWLNACTVFEKVSNGYDVAGLTNQVKLSSPIETGKWYDIRLEIGNDKVEGFLNDSLVMTYKEPQKLFALAGRDESSGDIILKVVNAYDYPVTTMVETAGITALGSDAIITSIATEKLEVENTLEEPLKYLPVQHVMQVPANNFEIKWKPYSINILRLKDPGYKKIAVKQF
ncbi:MAG: alpha-L-arabinofuranosidase C-terminal domain-containing protein [Bacteroidota bacterium]